MNFLFLVLMAVISFTAFVIGYKYFKKDALYILAIGGAVSANIYHIGNYAIQVGNIVFGIDSVIYTLFVFCIFVLFIDYSQKDAMSLTYTSMASILFTAFVQFIASWATGGIESGMVWGLCSFFISIVATYLAVIVGLWLFKKLQNKVNVYVNLCLGILAASIVNSIIYFGVVAIFTGGFQSNFLGVLAGSYIGKIMCIGFSIVSFVLVNKWRKNIK